MRDLPINLGGYRLMVTDEPQMKMKQNDQGELEPVTNRDGEQQFVVSLFAKPLPGADGRTGKGEEISVNLTADPGDGFEPGSYVELVNAVVNHYAIADKQDPGKIANAGLWFRAGGLKPAGSGGLSSAA